MLEIVVAILILALTAIIGRGIVEGSVRISEHVRKK